MTNQTTATEQTASTLPPVLGVGYVVLASACIAYLVLFMFGGASRVEPGTHPLMYSSAGVAAAFIVGVSTFAARKPQD